MNDWRSNSSNDFLLLVKLYKLMPRALVVRRVDNFIQRINPYLAAKIGAFLILIGKQGKFIHLIGIYLMDKVIHSSYSRA